eukprot:CAMPEP_0114533064 /NCGR_PEP_ID=MMETSP0109-20121206/27027_1 /TAXON_ID=29199 /ORGANISM="Chlorarachnion reptans, Strain CCCM449" /LENGTH=333 /DNA_ID=CAMNT_0001716225 /DNA_START=23 /DNA_END=1021 /DNA_ORIENTATION=-
MLTRPSVVAFVATMLLFRGVLQDPGAGAPQQNQNNENGPSGGSLSSVSGPLHSIAQFLLGKRLKWEFGRKSKFQIEQRIGVGLVRVSGSVSVPVPVPAPVPDSIGGKDGVGGVPDDFFMFLSWANSTFHNVTLLPLNEIFKKTMDMFRLTLFRKRNLMNSVQGYLPPTKSWRLVTKECIDQFYFCVKASLYAYEDEWIIHRFLNARGLRLIKWNMQASVNLPSFFIAEDPRDKTLVVSIRGTQHVNDVFTSFQTNVTVLNLFHYKKKSLLSPLERLRRKAATCLRQGKKEGLGSECRAARNSADDEDEALETYHREISEALGDDNPPKQVPRA